MSTGGCSFQMISSVSATCLLGFAVVCWPSIAGNRPLPCHCTGTNQCHENGYCHAGCDSGWFGPGCQVGNLALQKPAYQSSLFNGDFIDNVVVDNSAGMAVDGRNQSNNSRAQYCAHTMPTNNCPAWWYVELDRYQDIVIQDVTIVKRFHSGDPIENFSIVYSSSLESQQPDSNWSTCYYSSGTQPNIFFKYYCQGAATGRKLGILLCNAPYRNILTLCEVIVNGYYKIKCDDGFTGPGCLLYDCKATNCIGGCDDYGGCKYSTCPDSAFLPPDCWIRLPSLRNVEIVPVAACNSINITIDRQSVDGDLNFSSLILEMRSQSDNTNETYHMIDKSEFFNITVSAASGNTYHLRIIPRWCSDSSGSCFSGPSSNWTTITTGLRVGSDTKNGSCFHMNMSSTTSICEQLEMQITCRDKFNESSQYTSKGDTLCQLPVGVYRCSVSGNLTHITVYLKTVDGAIDFAEVQLDRNLPNTMVLVVSILSGLLICGIVIAMVILVMRRKLADSTAMSSAKDTHDVRNEVVPCPETYATLAMKTGRKDEEEYAPLSFSSELKDHEKENTEDQYVNL